MAEPSWIVCQIGAREHYAVARALHQHGELARLVTDVWSPPGSMLGVLKKSLGERYHSKLADAPVTAANLSCVKFEARAKARRLGDWPLMIARNQWFQRMASQELLRMPPGPLPFTVFAYSYAALDILRTAKARGWRTVLGQIDPGPPEERIVSMLYAANSDQHGHWSPVPAEYWRLWKEECALADRIVVNSEWSKNALIQEGVTAEKTHVIPLAYEFPDGSTNFERIYPERFTQERPLRVLFLGQVNIRKGGRKLLDAITLLQAHPITFWFVGDCRLSVAHTFFDDAKVKWFGQIPHSETTKYYRDADVFLFPTFSDGFGLTQLEAQAWRLPVIASRFCGNVVENDRNGLILKQLASDSIADALLWCLRNPQRLAEMSANAVSADTFSVNRVGGLLTSLFDRASVLNTSPFRPNTNHPFLPEA